MMHRLELDAQAVVVADCDDIARSGLKVSAPLRDGDSDAVDIRDVDAGDVVPGCDAAHGICDDNAHDVDLRIVVECGKRRDVDKVEADEGDGAIVRSVGDRRAFSYC